MTEQKILKSHKQILDFIEELKNKGVSANVAAQVAASIYSNERSTDKDIPELYDLAIKYLKKGLK